jgi:hypothetical protein
METKLKELVKKFSDAQFIYAISTPPLPWRERDGALKELYDEIDRIEKLLDEKEQKWTIK